MGECIKQAIVTGASSGIGKQIALALLEEGYEVYGIGRTFDESITDAHFHPVVLDLNDSKQVLAWLNSNKFLNLHVLVNNAGCAYYGLHETMDASKIEEMMQVNITIPMILTQHFIRTIKQNQGIVVFVSSASSLQHAPHGAVYAASKAAMLHFSESLFDEVRKHGVKVICLLPDMTATNLYRNANFEADEEEGCCLYPADIKDCLHYILHTNAIVNQIVLRPQYHRLKRK